MDPRRLCTPPTRSFLSRPFFLPDTLRYKLAACKAAFAPSRAKRSCSSMLINNAEAVLSNAASFDLQLRIIDLLVGLGSM